MKKNTNPSVDFEPEYIAVTDGSAYVTLQEANAIAVLDIAAKQFTGVYPLGTVDHSTVAIDLDSNGEAANVLTSWIIEDGSDFPRLTNVYVTKKKVREV